MSTTNPVSTPAPSTPAGPTNPGTTPGPAASLATGSTSISSEKAVSAATRVAKLLPADLTAAFLSAKAGLEAALKATESQGPVFWTFIAMLAVSPFYFRYVSKARDPLHISFLAATFAVFVTSIAYASFIGYLSTHITSFDVNKPLTAIAVVLPSIWAFVVAPAVLERLKETSAS